MRSKHVILIIMCVCSILALAGTPVTAHHAFSAEFDANKPVEMRGTVTRVQWVNPHVWVHMDVKKPDGTVESWAFEAGTPNNLFRRGFTKDSLLPGTEILVDGYQSKDGSRRANGRNMTFPDGKTLFMGSSGTGAPYELTPDHVKQGTGQAGPGTGQK
jgi:hypothetical protein